METKRFQKNDAGFICKNCGKAATADLGFLNDLFVSFCFARKECAAGSTGIEDEFRSSSVDCGCRAGGDAVSALDAFDVANLGDVHLTSRITTSAFGAFCLIDRNADEGDLIEKTVN